MHNFKMEMPSNKKFGWFFCGIFALVATYASFNNIFLLSKISFSILFLLLITTVFFSSKLDPLNKLWFNIGITLGKFVSPIILGALFFLLVSPIAITSRWFGRDELLIKKRKINTYWISRETDEPSNFKDQF